MNPTTTMGTSEVRCFRFLPARQIEGGSARLGSCVEDKRPVGSLPPSKPPTGPAPPRRSVCAPAPLTLSLSPRRGEGWARGCIADQPGKGERTMSFHSWLQNLRTTVGPGRRQRHHRRRGSLRAATHRPTLEVLEDRCVPAL